MADEYAPTEYYGDSPLAVAQTITNSKGKPETIYIDAETGQVVNNLKGYAVQDGDIYYHPKDSDDANEDGKVDTSEVSRTVEQVRRQGGNNTTNTPGPKATASNNFGYKSKPGLLGPAAMVGGLVNPGIGAAASMLSKAYNVGNMEAVNDARKGLGLPGLSMGQMAKQAMKDNKGQVGNINIGDKQYSVGFEALSPDNKTNMTYNEAKTRAAILGQKITETPKENVTPGPSKVKDKSLISKITGLEPGFAAKALGVEKAKKTDDTKKTPEKTKSLVEKATGLEKGWLGKALTDLTTTNKVSPETAVSLPNVVKAVPTSPTVAREQTAPNAVASTPSATKGINNTGFSQAATAGLPDRSTAIGPSQSNPLGVGAGSVGFAGRLNNPGVAAGAVPDKLGRVGLMSVNFDKMGLQPAMAAQMKSFQQKAIDAGIANKLSVDVNNITRTPDQQESIKAAGFSKTKNSYHLSKLGLAVDVSPTAVDAKGRITDQKTLGISRQIAKNLGLKTLDPSFDPAHMQASVPGQTARSLNARDADPNTGMVKLSPEEDLGVRVNSVPTPTARPSPTAPTPAKTFDSQVGLNATAPDQDQNAFGQMKQDMGNLGVTPANAVAPSNPTKAVATPAGLASMGFSNYSAAQKAQMSKAIAGELSQKSLANLTSKDPSARAEAQKEVGSMVAAMVNRDASPLGQTKAHSWQNPTQVNSLMPSKLATTEDNLSKNPAVTKTVNSFFSGGIPDAKMDTTNWGNYSVPGVKDKIGPTTNPENIGAHTFSVDKAFSPDKASQAAAKAFGTMAGTQFSPGKKTDDRVSNPSFSGMGTPTGTTPSKGLSTGLGVSDKSNTPGYGGAGLGYGGASSGAAAGSLGNPGGSSGAGGASGSQGSSSSGSGSSSSGSSGGSSSGGGNSNSRDGASSPAGGYSSSASKGSTGGL